MMVLGGCGSCGAESTEETVVEPEPAGSEELGTLVGVVRFAEGAELPSFPPARDTSDPPEECPEAQITDRQPVQMGEDRGLGGISVVAGAFEGEAPPSEPKTHQVRIDNCRLTPRTLVATGPSQSGERPGDTIVITNGGDVPFVPSVPGRAMRNALLKDASFEYTATTGGVHTINCPFPSPTCGRTEVIIAYHPVVGLTDENGAFRIENVPPGQDIEFHAWHPLFGEASETVNIEAGESEEVVFTLTPAAEAAPDPTEEPEPTEAAPETGEVTEEAEVAEQPF